jgi:hypothetical protein
MMSMIVAPETRVHATLLSASPSCTLTLPSMTYGTRRR